MIDIYNGADRVENNLHLRKSTLQRGRSQEFLLSKSTHRKFFCQKLETYLLEGQIRISISAKYILNNREQEVTYGKNNVACEQNIDACGENRVACANAGLVNSTNKF